MSRRSIFLITDSLYNCDCRWSAVPTSDRFKLERVRVNLLVAAHHKCMSHSPYSSKACTLYLTLHKGETCKDPHNTALALCSWDNLCERKTNK